MTDIDPIAAIKASVKSLLYHDVPLGSEVVVLGSSEFEALRRHQDVESGRVIIEPTEEPDRWLVYIPEIELRRNVLVSGDLSQILKKETA